MANYQRDERGKLAKSRPGIIAEEYLKKYPGIRSHTAVRMIIADALKKDENNPEFTQDDYDRLRSAVRYLKGSAGNKKRAGANTTWGKYANDDIIDEPFSENWDKYVIQKASRNIFLAGDFHVPYHDKDAVRAAFEWAAEHNCDTIVLNGDVVDFYQCSRFTKNPSNPSMEDELSMLQDFLWSIREMFPNAKIIYKEGNHEARLDKYMQVKAPELYKSAKLKLNDLLHFEKIGIDYVCNERVIVAGKVNILHGHEIPGNRQANVAKQVFAITNENTIVCHSHVADKTIVPTLNGTMKGAWSVPCLCGLHPKYKRVNKWTHGFLRILLQSDDTFRIFQGEIYNGKVF
ncbi:MAG: metallophosphoesterase [Candidatus Pacebacteria bacterium]|nr:metallophosphoesterase [Candidatus Paceibacterota bacterium]